MAANRAPAPKTTMKKNMRVLWVVLKVRAAPRAMPQSTRLLSGTFHQYFQPEVAGTEVWACCSNEEDSGWSWGCFLANGADMATLLERMLMQNKRFGKRTKKH